MSWMETENREGVYGRPIGENEDFIKLVGDAGLQLPYKREGWAINSTATVVPTGSFESADLAALFRRAWGYLRFQHPSLAAELVPSSGVATTFLLYHVPASGAALDAWVDRTFRVAADASSSADVIPTFRPSPYANLVWIPRSGELLLHTSHWRTDGVGVLLLLDALLALASDPTLADPASLAWGTETERLAPSVEVAAAMPAMPTPEIKERATALSGTFAHAFGAIGIPYLGDADTLPAGTRSATLTFDKEETKNIIAACKQLGFSVHVAVHASVAGANYALADETERARKHYTSTVRFSLRPYVSAPDSTPASAAGLYTTGWVKRVEPEMSWAERTRSYADEYKKGITREFLEAHREYATQLAAMLRGLKAPGEGDVVPPPPSDMDISSVGVVDDKMVRKSYGTSQAGFEVKSVGLGVEILTRQGTTFVWTFREQLNLSVAYNEAYHSEEQMQEFVRTVRLELLKGLFPEGSINAAA
ncbi:hypothetical protein PGQ11_010006 [Apiospora arundinis]|uniref:Uncharacterized protein n=1 Tax=Apiospora arundinis TaxID=335852 RepID=A0ABR2I9I5_9PEZI